jgi:hypothetical protein
VRNVVAPLAGARLPRHLNLDRLGNVVAPLAGARLPRQLASHNPQGVTVTGGAPYGARLPRHLNLDRLVRVDYGLSIHNMDDEIGPDSVTLSEAKGLSRGAQRCFAALSMTELSPYGCPDSVFHLHYRAHRRFIGPLPLHISTLFHPQERRTDET